MDFRKITIMSTKTQRKYVLESAATTLGELKHDMDAADIDYSDMTFYEGTSKTEMLSDESILPKKVTYKGVETDNLVFLLTNTEKKIKSGLTRIEAYEAVKNNNLAEEIKAIYGKNYTQCKTEELEDFLNTSLLKTRVAKCGDYNLRMAFFELVNLLDNKNVINPSEASSILDKIAYKEAEVAESPYSDEELDDMIASMY